jgi:hypothetical protein
MNFEIRTPKFLRGEKAEPPQAKPPGEILEHLTPEDIERHRTELKRRQEDEFYEREVRRRFGTVIDVEAVESTQVEPKAPKQLPPVPPAEH